MNLGLSITATWLLWIAAAAAVVFLLVAVAPRLVFWRRQHRTWFQSTVLAANVFLIVAAIAGAAGLRHYNNQLGDIPRLEFGQGVLAEEVESGEPQNYLLVGVDTTEGLDPADPIRIGRDSSTNTDTIMVLRIDPTTDEAHLVSFPRDLWLPIAGTGRNAKINSAFGIGGPETLIQTIEDNFGIPIHHYVHVNFAGFKALVDSVGGVPIWFPHSVRDKSTGFLIEVPEGGQCVNLDGDLGLAFSRTRVGYETLVDGRWVHDPSGDFGRIQRQQLFMREALDRAIDRGARNPVFLEQLLDIGEDHVALDAALTAGDLLELGGQLSDFGSDRLHMYELPGYADMVGEASIVRLDESEAQAQLNIFRGLGGGVPTVEGMRVSVRNGTGISGQATEVRAELEGAGFQVVDARDDDSFGHEQTVLRYTEDTFLFAVFVARFIGDDVVLEEVPDLGSAVVEVVTGADWDGLLDQPLELEDVEGLLPEELRQGGDTGATSTSTSTSTSTPLTSTTVRTSSTVPVVPEQPDGVDC